MVEAKLVREVNENYYAIGKADDIAILLSLEFPQTVFDKQLWAQSTSHVI
jgi:hypothetical protein